MSPETHPDITLPALKYLATGGNLPVRDHPAKRLENRQHSNFSRSLGSGESREEQIGGNMEQLLLHRNAAYNLARWLTRNDTDAEDVVQEAYLRAFRHFSSYHGSDGRPWLLAIVRNTFYTWAKQNRVHKRHLPLDEAMHNLEENRPNSEALLLKEAKHRLLRLAMAALPAEFREVLLLREWEGCSYKEIADMVEIPVGTVMSRLARARKSLEHRLSASPEQQELQTCDLANNRGDDTKRRRNKYNCRCAAPTNTCSDHAELHYKGLPAPPPKSGRGQNFPYATILAG